MREEALFNKNYNKIKFLIIITSI